MSRWTPSGWMICLGAAFKWSFWEDNRYTGANKSMTRHGSNFVEETQARSNTCEHVYFSKMSLLECLAESMEEAVEEEVDPSKIWRSLSLAQRKIFAQRKFLDLEPGQAYMTEGGILSVPQGCIIIQAADFSQPAKSNK
jgi:hypothetical protein